MLESLRMRMVKSQIAISIAALCIVMLLYSPLCSLSCAFSSCAFSKAEAAKPDEQSGHCRGSHESQEESSTPQPSPSAPSEDSGNCPSHVDAIAALPSVGNANVGLHQVLQPVAAEPVYVTAFHLDTRGVIRAEGTAFRSPPTKALNSILRI